MTSFTTESPPVSDSNNSTDVAWKGMRREIGIFPADWKVKPLLELCWFQEGPGLRQWQFTTSGMKVINVTNLENNVLNLDSTERHISLPEFNRMYQHFSIDAGDILMASSGNSYSKTAKVRDRDLPLMMNTSVIRFKPIGKTVCGFLWAFLNSSVFKDQIDLMITGGAQPNFGPYHLKRVLMPVPSSEEQRAIAEVLSDVDRLLGALEALMAKRRAIKQAATQQLLTGKTRLPGFPQKDRSARPSVGTLPMDWTVAALNDVCLKIQDGTHFSPTPGGSDYLYVTSRNIGFGILDISNADTISTAEHRKIYSRCDTRYGDLLLTKDGANTGNAALNTLCEECSLLSSVAFLRFDPRLDDARFFLQYILSGPGQRRLKEMMSGNAITRLTLDKIKRFIVPRPTPGEQEAISTILSDMDDEIAALERRRDKTRAIKQGIMQELLTGRVRLVKPEAVQAGT